MENSIYKKLFAIQQHLVATKDLYNKFGKYNYRSCESILASLKEQLAENNVIITLNDEILKVDDRYYVKATATLVDIENGDSISTTALAREELTKAGMDASQITGSCSSYARKYALNGLFAIDDTKDSDYTNTGDSKPTVKAEPKCTSKQIDEMKSLGVNIENSCKYYHVDKVEDLTSSQADHVIRLKMEALNRGM